MGDNRLQAFYRAARIFGLTIFAITSFVVFSLVAATAYLDPHHHKKAYVPRQGLVAR